MAMQVPITVPDGFRGYMLRVDPSDHGIVDEFDITEPDLAMWRVEHAMEDHHVRNIVTVRRSVCRWTRVDLEPLGYPKSAWEVIADAYIRSALVHPRSPFAIGYRRKGTKHDMTVIFRGEWFSRDRRGVLTLIPGADRDPDWPTPERWGLIDRLAHEWLRNLP